MRNLLHGALNPVRAIVITAAAAAAVLAGTQASAFAAPAAGTGHTVRLVSTTLTGTEFDGFGEGRSAFIALRNARTDAHNQAAAAGFSVCTTIFEDSSFDPGFGTFVGESDILCTS
jgi:hypothetical protein